MAAKTSASERPQAKGFRVDALVTSLIPPSIRDARVNEG
jgi:hypothetical protein